MGQCGLFDFSWKQQLTSWTIFHNLDTIWLLNKLTLVSSWIASNAWRFIPKKTKLKIHWTVSKIPIVCYHLPLHALRTFTSHICISITHGKQSMFSLRGHLNLFYPEVKNLKLCQFVTNVILLILLTSQTFNYCWPKTTTGLPVDITACCWQWSRWRGGGEYSVSGFALLRTS